MAVAANPVPYEEILYRYEEMKRIGRELGDYVNQPRPELGATMCHAWAQGLARHLLSLHEKLSAHFQEEEAASGLMHELLANFPHSARIVKGLKKEHQQMLREIRALLPEALRYAEACPDSGLGLRRRTLRLLDLMADHETREASLVEQLYTQDIGLGE